MVLFKNLAHVYVKAIQIGVVSLIIYDLKGAVVQTQECFLSNGTNTFEMNVNPNLRNGIYILSVKENGKYASVKLVISK